MAFLLHWPGTDAGPSNVEIVDFHQRKGGKPCSNAQFNLAVAYQETGEQIKKEPTRAKSDQEARHPRPCLQDALHA